MKILVTGANGLVGSHLVENFNPAEGSSLLTPDQTELDITDQKSVKSFFEMHKPDAVVHFAAFTDVSAAEEQRNHKEASCWIVNVEGTTNLIKESVKKNNYFVYISTDVVFPGSKSNPGPYSEDSSHSINPELLSWYGVTKREGEIRISQNLKNSAILRISNPVRAKYSPKLDYARKILSLFDANKLYPMFNDQYLTLTYINEVTKTIRLLLRKRATGIFHTSSTNLFTPFKLTNFLLEKARDIKNAVSPVSLAPFLKDNPSRYPQFGGLKVEKTQNELGLKFMRWEETIEAIVNQLN